MTSSSSLDPGEAVLKGLDPVRVHFVDPGERFTAWKARPDRLEDADFEYQWDD